MGFGEKFYSVRSKDVATSLVRYQRWPWKRPRGYATFGAPQHVVLQRRRPRHCGSSRSPHTSSPRWCLGASHCEVVPSQPAKLLQLRCLSGSFSWETTILLVKSWWNGKIPPWKSWVISIYRIFGFFMIFSWFFHGMARQARHLLPSFGWLSGKGICTASGARVTIAGSDDVLTETVRCVMKDRNCWSMLIWIPIWRKFGSIDWFLPIQKAQCFQVSILDRVNPWSPGLWSIFVPGGVPFYS